METLSRFLSAIALLQTLLIELQNSNFQCASHCIPVASTCFLEWERGFSTFLLQAFPACSQVPPCIHLSLSLKPISHCIEFPSASSSWNCILTTEHKSTTFNPPTDVPGLLTFSTDDSANWPSCCAPRSSGKSSIDSSVPLGQHKMPYHLLSA